METIEGKYISDYKVGEVSHHMFTPTEVVEDGKSTFHRIGDDTEKFGSNRNYVIIEVNINEQKLIDETI